ncbi:MAG: RNA methyltransferase [Candidatus Omnitrophica bacterium]|nr:RNA methyltransferase [Candidatus Omnitrophota bacterium]
MKLYGINPVLERIRANPASVKKIYIQQGVQGGPIQKKAAQNHVPFILVHESKMSKIGRDKNHQGFIADVEDFEYAELDVVLSNAAEKHRTLIFLDGLNDPQNLGVMIRSLACLGRFAIILTTHNSVSVTEAVLRIASGGDNYVPICRVPNLVNAIKKAKEENFWIIAADVSKGQFLGTNEFPPLVGVVIGSEQKGIRDVVLAQVDERISIPMYAETISFNAAQALTIIAYEITRQKRQKQKNFALEKD